MKEECETRAGTSGSRPLLVVWFGSWQCVFPRQSQRGFPVVTITGISSCRRAMLAVAVALVCVTPGRATLVAYYTFDDDDTTITGDGLGDGDPNNNLTPGDTLYGIDDPNGTPFHIELLDASGHGNTAVNSATTFSGSGRADYNGNGIVDAADYTVWRDTLGSTTDLRQRRQYRCQCDGR